MLWGAAPLLARGHQHGALPTLFPSVGWEEGTWMGFAVPYLVYLSEVFYWEGCFLNLYYYLIYLIIIKLKNKIKQTSKTPKITGWVFLISEGPSEGLGSQQRRATDVPSSSLLTSLFC